MKPSTKPLFWRHPELPYLELRWVQDGRKVSYAPIRVYTMGFSQQAYSGADIRALQVLTIRYFSCCVWW